MTPERRDRPVTRVLLWFVAPLDDRLRGLSLTRILAVLCFVYVGHSVWEERALSWVDFWVLALGICTAYGKKVLLAFLQRIGLRSVSQDVTLDLRQEIVRRREDGKDFDAEVT